MANFPKAYPAIGRSTGLTGPAGTPGTAGATGNGAVFQSVDALSGTPRSVSDWGTILNTAISGGIRHFVFGAFTYPFSTQINGANGIYFQGSGTVRQGGGTGTLLQWTGTGSGAAINWQANEHPVIRDMGITYTSSSYTGRLVELGGTGFGATNGIVDNVVFDSAGGITTAMCGLSLEGIDTVTVRDCEFGNFGSPCFATAGVRGRESPDFGANSWSNVARFEGCTFHTHAIVNPGPNWVLSQCVFEVGAMSPGDACIYFDIQITTYLPQLTLINCSFWDASSNGAFIRAVRANALHGGTDDAKLILKLIGCEDYCGGFPDFAIQQTSGGSLHIIGGNVTHIIDVGDGSSSALYRMDVLCVGTGGTNLQNANTGHRVTTISAGGVFNGIVPVSHQTVPRQIPQVLPTFALHAGISNIAITAETFGSVTADCAGNISFQNTSGSPSVTGALIDVTFGLAPIDLATGHLHNPIVQISPVNTVGTTGISNFYTCQTYATITGGASGDLSTFSIGVAVAMPAGATIALAYNVVWLYGR